MRVLKNRKGGVEKMTKYYIKQQVFSWSDRFNVKNGEEKDVYVVKGQLFSWGKKITIYDTEGRDVLYIEQKLMSWLPTYSLFVQGHEIAEIKKELTFLKPKYKIHGPDWHVEGSVWQHDYRMMEHGEVVATVQKEWLTWGDSYMLNVKEEEAAVLALGIMIVIDCVMESEAHSSS